MTTDRKQLAEFAATAIGREFIELARNAEVGAAQRQQDSDAAAAAQDAVDAELRTQREALEAANLFSFGNVDGEGHCCVQHSRVPVVLLNHAAHPAALVSTALARAERVQAFARVLEESDGLGGDDAAAAYTLARMIEEVVDVLRATVSHDGIMRAPISTMQTAKG
jgi:hypothetical protein